MATDSRIIADLHTSDAEFRTWVQAVQAGIEATGAVKEVAAGEINTATVLKPAGVNTVAGFQVFKLAGHDGLPDVFIKVEYATNGQSSGGTGPALTFTVGYGHNGAATITGNNTGQIATRNGGGTVYNAGAGSTVTQFASGNGVDFLSMAPTYLNAAADNNRHSFFHVERLHDENGLLGEGLYIFASGAGVPSTGYDRVLPFAGAIPSAGTTSAQHPCLDPGVGGGARTVGLDIAVAAHQPVHGRQLVSMLLDYRNTDIAGSPADFALDHLGIARPYRALGTPGPSAGQISASAIAGCCLAMPWF